MKKIEVVCAVLHDQSGRVLIAQRRSVTADGVWEFPGGKVEADESKEAACIREIKEELDVDIVVDEFLCEFDDVAFDPIVHVSAFRSHIVEGSVCFHAHYQGKWVTIQELDAYHFQAADEPLLTLLRYQDDKKTFHNQC